ncbi:MAG: ATP-binding protein, partial [Candidatus Marinimicrobia bacterium]|nr:ATP-binding protein [Candidatus Neomarinimicrobiota bacterium]
GVSLRQCYVYRGPEQPGECIDGVPWAAMKVGARIGRLKDWLQTTEATHRRGEIDEYEIEARRIYGRLREAWERAAEEVLLNGVVTRFDPAIHTQQLSRVADITPGDIQIIDQGMTKSSRFLEGHDEAGAVADPVPSPNELRQDITALEDWVRGVRQRRRN